MNNDLTMRATESEKQRVIRVFISSTFRDMMRERDHLVKEVFPALRHICAKRFVTFTEVDLRWGITEEQAAEGKVLPLCLAEIERSRPYFIGLLGERYGWIPDAIPADVIEKEPWLKEHLHGCKSVTELEILHGVLNNPEMRGHSFFYFRDPVYAGDSSLTEEERREMTERDIPAEIKTFGPEEAARRTEERKGKLSALKQQIRVSGLPLVEPYANPEELAKIIEKQFGELIDHLYPEAAVPDALDRERLAHEAHAKNKLFACIDRPAHLRALNTFAEATEHNGQGLVITGESGSGKTALLAAWARDWAKSHPEEFLFQHYFGATPDSSSPDGFLRRLLGELKKRFDITEDIPTDPDKLREALPFWLAQTIKKGLIILLLDGLNQVQGEDPDKHLNFLPRHFPQHLVVLASSLPGPGLDALRNRGWTEHDLPLADESEVNAMVGVYLDLHARTLDASLRSQLVTAPDSKNPLFLRTILEELRQFGRFEKLPDQVRHYLEAGNPKELFLRVIRRWQADFDGKDTEKEKERIDLVRRGLTHLWAAREGLAESEWLDLLGNPGTPLPRAYWTPLFFAMEPHLSQRSGLFAFGHDFIHQAVETEFLSAVDDRKAAHLAVANYFGAQKEMTPRKTSEWPWQLHAAGEWDRLEACLIDIPLFLALYNEKTQWDLTGYWHPLRKIGRDMGTCYTDAYQKWIDVPENAEDDFVPAQLGQFLSDNGAYPAAEPLLQHSMEVSKRVLGPEHPSTLTSVNNLAQLLQSKGDYAGAQPLYERTLEVRGRVLGPEHPDTLMSVNNLAQLLQSKGDYAEAQPLFEHALEASERILGPEHPNTVMSVNNLALLLHSEGDYAGAQPLFERALAAHERVLGPEHPSTLMSVNNLALLLHSEGDYAGAQPLFERALAAHERVLGPEHPSTLMSVSNLASLLQNKGDYAGAQPLFERALAVRKRVLGPEHPDTLTSVNNLAELLRSKGDYAGAQPLFERALKGFERVLGPEHPDTLTSVNNLAELLRSKGDYAGAQPLFERALKGFERVLGPEHPSTLMSMNNLAGLLMSKDDYAGAQPLFERALKGFERVLGPEHPSTLMSMNNLAGLLMRKGDYVGAQPLFERALEVHERILGPEHPDTLASVYNLATLLAKRGDYEGAQPLFECALEGFERVLGPEHPNTLMSLNNLVLLLLKTWRFCKAWKLIRQVSIRRAKHRAIKSVLGPEHPSLLGSMNLAQLLYSKGDYARALEACERVLGPEHPYTLNSIHNLADALEKTGRVDEARSLRLLHMERLAAKSDTPPLTLRQIALDYFMLGNYDKAEELLRRLLAQDFEPAGNRLHVARLCLLAGRNAEARELVSQAANYRAQAPAYFSPRLFWFQLVLTLLEHVDSPTANTESAIWLGRMKTALQSDDAYTEWAMQPVLDNLKSKLSEPDHALLTALVTVLNDRTKLPELKEFQVWREAKPLPLDGE